MSRAWVAVLAVGFLACGEEVPDSVKENGPPVIDEVRLTPDSPSENDSIGVAISARDPDRDRVHVAVDWYLNGSRVQSGPKTTLDARIARGDRIYAIARVRDGTSEVSETSETLRVGNAVPVVTAVRITPDVPLASDDLEARLQASDSEGDSLEYRYRWYVNGDQVAENSGTFGAGGAVRGDEITVWVAATDGRSTSEWFSSDIVRLQNAAPMISSQPKYDLGADGLYTYVVQATDPDGDTPLKYELLKGPTGMTVDTSAGTVSWSPTPDIDGVFSIEVAVSDGHGGQAVQAYTLELSWSQPPASAR